MPSTYISKKKRQLVFVRAKYRCEYCQCRTDTALETFEIDHILPIVLGGGVDDLTNLALACRGCNSRKAMKIWIDEADSEQRIPLFNPRKQDWKRHFKWSDDFSIIIGKTPVGKVTVEELRLNRTGVINIRRLMILGRIHPPLDTILT